MGEWLAHHEVAKQARWRPDELALVQGELSYTYSDLRARTDQLARFLRESGASMGDHVLAHASNHVDLYTLFFACSKRGTVFSPVSRYLSEADLAYVCETLDPACLIFTEDEQVEETLATVRAHVGSVPSLSLDAWADESRTSALADVSADPVTTAPDVTPDTIHNLFWTSGTTGRPKGVLRDHTATLHFADPLLEEFPFRRATRRLTTNDMMFAAPYLQYGLPTVMTGGTNVVLRSFDPETVCETVATHDINTTLLVFSQASLLLEYVQANDLDIEIEYLHAVLPSDAIAEQLAGISRELYHIYATTEVGLPLVTRLEPPIAETPTLGRPGVGADIALVPLESDRPAQPAAYRSASPGDEGELYCRGAVTMTRYLDTEAVDDVHDEDWVPTGDVFRVTAAGDLVFVGRADNRLRSGGVNIYPENVEQVLVRHPAVEEAVVVGVDDETWNHRVCAVLVPTPDAAPGESLAEDVDAFCQATEGLARSKRPREYAIETNVDALPTSAVGKIDRNAIVAKYFDNRS